jgi:hypothetical protein
MMISSSNPRLFLFNPTGSFLLINNLGPDFLSPLSLAFGLCTKDFSARRPFYIVWGYPGCFNPEID